MTTPSDNVRKAAEAISALPEAHSKEFDEAVESIIERHCHVTEMEAVVEKCREATQRAVEVFDWLEKSEGIRMRVRLARADLIKALASIDALKGDKR